MQEVLGVGCLYLLNHVPEPQLEEVNLVLCCHSLQLSTCRCSFSSFNSIIRLVNGDLDSAEILAASASSGGGVESGEHGVAGGLGGTLEVL